MPGNRPQGFRRVVKPEKGNGQTGNPVGFLQFAGQIMHGTGALNNVEVGVGCAANLFVTRITGKYYIDRYADSFQITADDPGFASQVEVAKVVEPKPFGVFCHWLRRLDQLEQNVAGGPVTS